jgi:hypothetical protein
LNGAPHTIIVACYSADPSPSPIKTQVKATSRGELQERKTGDCGKEKQRTAGGEKEGEKKKQEIETKRENREEREQKKKKRSQKKRKKNGGGEHWKQGATQ